MLGNLNRKAWFSLYLAVIKPVLVVSSVNMTTKAPTSESASTASDLGKYSVAYVTVPNDEVAKNIGYGLVQNKLAACVNIIPRITSIYEWKGEVNEDKELLLMIKTRSKHVDKLTEFVRTNHPYSVCEVISVAIDNGNPPYLSWIGETVPENIDNK